MLTEQIEKFAAFLDAQQCNEAVRYHAENMGVDYGGGHHLRSRIITRLCSGCGVNHLDFITSKLDGNDWKDINETEIRLFTEEPLEVAVKS